MRRSVRLPGGCAIVEQGCFCGCGKIFAEIFGTGKIALITDENVARLYGSAAKSALQCAGFIVCDYAIPAGEQSKNLSEYAKILSFLASSGFTGGDTVLSFGGGVVSDLGGFAAATYHRGIRHAIIPTTVLSAIDAAIGGKTAVDLPEGKNLAGCFFQPEADALLFDGIEMGVADAVFHTAARIVEARRQLHPRFRHFIIGKDVAALGLRHFDGVGTLHEGAAENLQRAAFEAAPGAVADEFKVQIVIHLPEQPVEFIRAAFPIDGGIVHDR